MTTLPECIVVRMDTRQAAQPVDGWGHRDTAERWTDYSLALGRAQRESLGMTGPCAVIQPDGRIACAYQGGAEARKYAKESL